MRSPRSEALVLAARSAGVLAPVPIAVKTSNSIPVFSASVFWNAFIRVKMRSGVGRFVVEGVAIAFGSLGKVLVGQLYTEHGICFAAQFHCSHPARAGILSVPRTASEVHTMKREHTL